jgi:hypothetical protein
LQVQLCLIESSFLLQHLRLCRRGPGSAYLHLPRCGLRVAIVGFRLHQFSLRLRYLGLGSVSQGATRVDRRSAGSRRCHGLIILLLGNLLLVDQLPVTSQIILRFYIVRFGLGKLCLG